MFPHQRLHFFSKNWSSWAPAFTTFSRGKNKWNWRFREASCNTDDTIFFFNFTSNFKLEIIFWLKKSYILIFLFFYSSILEKTQACSVTLKCHGKSNSSVSHYMQKGPKIIHILVYCYILSLKRENLSLVMVLLLEEENKFISLASCLNQKVKTWRFAYLDQGLYFFILPWHFLLGPSVCKISILMQP